MAEESYFERDRVAVLLATYNGGRFLKEQLESLFAQSFSHFRIFVRDDCSSDGSRAILGYYSKMYPGRLVLLPHGERLGARGSFSCLMESCDADYVFFCDQDDVWLPDKIERGIVEIIRLENMHGVDAAILLHTDLKVVDVGLNPIHDSFARYQNLNPQQGSVFNKLLMQNIATGCTIGANRALLRLASPVPCEAVMHDWWIALVASAFGVIEYSPEPTILYRQHDHNEKGAKAWNLGFMFKVLARNLLGSGEISKSLRDARSQAAAFHWRFKDRLDPKFEQLLSEYVRLDECGYFKRRITLIRYGILKHGFSRNFGLMLYL